MDAVAFDLWEVMDNLASVAGLPADVKGLELLFVEPPQLPVRLVGDPLRLGQVLINLTKNAVKFTERGEITVSIEVLEWRATGVQLRFGVRDTGPGISLEEQQRLFQPLSQADASTNRRDGDSGQGLANCRHLVRLMDGTIEVISTPGRGSHFTFTVRFGLQPGSTAGPAAPRPDALSGARLLVVDDNAMAREVLVSMSSTLGLVADSAASGEDALHAVALAAAARQPFDLVLVDLKMPGMDGVECARQLSSAARPHFPPPALILSAFGRAEALRRLAAKQVTVRGVLTKPVTPTALLDACARALGTASHHGTPSARRDQTPHGNEARMAGSTAGAPTAPVIGVDSFSHLPGVDQNIGRMRTAGNDRLYRRVLVMFVDSQHNFTARFRAARASGDILAARRAVHDLKSDSGTIGACEVQKAAEALENACTLQAADGVIEQLLETVTRTLVPVIDGLEPLRAHWTEQA
jgi:CheY-like chemotaxis protein/HPt (histidine-containing phosphotransfer) domain-containing protein